MAISLSNHEDRIKALEDIDQSIKFEYLWNENRVVRAGEVINMSKQFTNFDGIIISSYDTIDGNDYVHVWLFTPLILLNKEYLLMYTDHSTPYETNLQIMFTSESSIKITIGLKSAIQSIIGLKLYYSFSYNIIYRILLRKISRLVKKLHFNLFEISSRRGGANYGY